MKKIEEASNDYAQINDDKYCNVSKNFDKYDIAQAFQHGAEFAQRVEWRPIINYFGLYEISSNGDVKSLARKSKNNKNKNEIILSKHKNKIGYIHVGLTNEIGIRKNYDMHRLVAEAFIPNPENKPQVNHIDGDKQNNNVSNLEWCTCSQNIKHAYKLNLQKPTRYWEGNFGANHHSSIKVRCLDDAKEFDSITESAIFYGLKRCSISLVCKGKLKTTGGKRFEFIY